MQIYLIQSLFKIQINLIQNIMIKFLDPQSDKGDKF